MKAKPKIGVIGQGHVGSALERGMARAGYEVRTTGKGDDEIRRVGEWADVVVLAVPFGALDDALRALGPAIDGKVAVDVTNALTPDYQLALGFSTSGAEELQRKVPRAQVVKAFNTVFAQHMDDGHVKDKQLTALVAGDDGAAKETVRAIASAIGFDAVDAGPLMNARWLESLGYLNIQLGYRLGMGSDIGFTLVHPAPM